MENIYEKVKKYIAEYHMISEGDTIVAGISGGADSVCLLHILCELSKETDFRLLAVHVHHGVRAEADKDADYVECLCHELHIPFFLKKVNMAEYAKENGLSPEEAGRKLRYQAFEDILEKENMQGSAYKIAVAHNHNDRAETMLFHLFRGSGLKGLGSIRPVRDKIIRPLLCLDRTEIEAYLEERKIAFCIDSTNDEDTYTRNKIRHHILAYAETDICRNAAAHINSAADVLTETEDFLTRQTELAYKRCLECHAELKDGTTAEENTKDADKVILNLDILRKEDSFLQKRILIRCLEQITPYRQDIVSEHIHNIMDIIGKEGCKELSLPYHINVYKEYSRLIFYKIEDTNSSGQDEDCIKQASESLSVPVPGEVSVPGVGVFEFKYIEENDFFYKKGQIIPEKTYTKWFDYDKITTVLLLRTRKTGDYLTINHALQKKSLKEYMINEKIPKKKRESIYLLADGSHILWIPGYRISQFYKVNENTKRILQVQLRERRGEE